VAKQTTGPILADIMPRPHGKARLRLDTSHYAKAKAGVKYGVATDPVFFTLKFCLRDLRGNKHPRNARV